MSDVNTKLFDWIRGSIANNTYSRFDDLHLEEVFELDTSPTSWLSAMADACSILDKGRRNLPDGFSICIGISLRSADLPMGVTFDDADGLCEEFTYNTPSIYIFETGSEPWVIQGEGAKIISSVTFPWNGRSKMSIHFEYLAPFESEYRRSFWIVV